MFCAMKRELDISERIRGTKSILFNEIHDFILKAKLMLFLAPCTSLSFYSHLELTD